MGNSDLGDFQADGGADIFRDSRNIIPLITLSRS